MAERMGLLLTNVGSPAAPTPAALRRYLRRFLSDRRVVDLPRPLWLPLLYLVILPARSRRAAHAYASIWRPEGSPQVVIMRALAAGLAATLRSRFDAALAVELGMAYGEPSICHGLQRLRDHGCRHILVLPLFPQYSSPTTGSAHDAVLAALAAWRRVPELRTIAGYHDHRGYIDALARSVSEFWQRGGEPERLLVSFHGIPRRYDEAGDPYGGQCVETARRFAAALGLSAERWQLAFQSRFGREEWLQPYTDATLRQWARDGLASVDVVCPGFAADCLETLEEIAIRARASFLQAGGRRLRYIPALNDRPEHIAALADLVAQHLRGWT
jgi:ferrochelatase